MIESNEYQRRRAALAAEVGTDGLAIVLAASERIRSRDSHYPFRQDSDFAYLTGFPEPDAVAVLAPGRAEGAFVLFVRPRDATREIWDGRRAGPVGAVQDYGADQAYPLHELPQRLLELLGQRSRLFYTQGQHPEFDQRLLGWMNDLKQQSRRGVTAPSSVVSVDTLIHDMRLFKSPAELAQMRHAATVSAAAHRRAMKACRVGMMEYQLAAEIRHEFEHAEMTPAYSSIVGGGANAGILHYVENSAVLRDGDLVLIDAGSEYRGYCADITRTFPVNGRFTAPQRRLYEAVLQAQLAAIAAIRPGVSWNLPHEVAVRSLTQSLVGLGLLLGDVDELIEKEAFKRYYMHSTGHWLGADVHDVGAYKINKQWRNLAENMVLTVEPGLYVAADDLEAPAQYRGIGIRIEDDVVVTADGVEVLTAAAPKSIEAIEACMRAVEYDTPV